MATITNLKAAVDTDITNKVAPSSISPGNVGNNVKAVLDELRLRGITVIDDVAGLSTLNSADFVIAYVKNVGFFKDSATGPANGTSIYSGVGGRFWVLQTILEEMDVFLVGGQSNMRGLGTAASSPQPQPDTVYKYDPGTEVFENVTNQEIIGSVGPIPPGTRGSAWPTFGIVYHMMTGRKVCIIPAAIDGSGQIAGSDTGFGNWGPAGTLYDDSITAVQGAMAAIEAAGFIPVLRGVIWGQGENDAAKINATTETQAEYQNAFTQMIADYRTDLGADLPFYIFQTGTDTGASDTGYAQIRAAQQAVVDANPLRNKMLSTNAIDFPARALMTDAVHYNQTALNELGTIGAQQVLNDLVLQWQRSGTNLSYMLGRVGIGIKLPTHPFQVRAAGEPAKFTTTAGGASCVILESTAAGGSDACGLRFMNNLGLQAQFTLGSSANVFNPNGITLHPFTGDLMIGSNTGNFRVFTSGSGPQFTATKLKMDNTGRFVFTNILGDPTIEASAVVSFKSVTGGVQLPNMTKAQRDAIASPANGLAVYQTDNTPGLRVFNGTNWMRYTETAD